MKKFFVALMLISAVAIMFAQEYTLDQLIENGLEQVTAIRQQKLSHSNSKSNLTSSALDLLLPDASVSAGRSNTRGDYSNNAGLSISKSLSINEPTYFSLKESIISMKNADYSWDAIRKSVAYEIFSRYIDVLEAEKNLEILKEQHKLQEKVYDQTNTLYQSNRKTMLDLRQSEIALLNAQISVRDGENQLQKNRENLFDYLNMDDHGFKLSDTTVEVSSPEDIEYDDPLDVRIMKNNISIMKSNLTHQWLNFFPDVSASWSYSYSFSPDDETYNDISDWDEYDDSYTIGLTASYSLYKLLEHGFVYKRARNNLTSSQLDLEDTIDADKLELKQLKQDWQTLNETWEISQRANQLAQENLTMAEEKFRLGMLNLLDLDNARIDYFNAQQTLNTKHYNLLKKQEEINLLLSREILGKW